MLSALEMGGAELNATCSVTDGDGETLRLTPLHLALWHTRSVDAALPTDSIEFPAWALLNVGASAVVVRGCVPASLAIRSWLGSWH
jgi:hypothetical protein